MPAAAESRLPPARVDDGRLEGVNPRSQSRTHGLKNRRYRPGTHVHTADTEERSKRRRKRTMTEGGDGGWTICTVHDLYRWLRITRVGTSRSDSRGQVVLRKRPAVNRSFVFDVSIGTRKSRTCVVWNLIFVQFSSKLSTKNWARQSTVRFTLLATKVHF